MSAWYNEIDPDAVAVLRQCIRDGAIAPGDVDTRDIRDVKPEDLAGYEQHHFFAGAGLWSVALRLAGWSDDRPITTGSCPCQPFSSLGLKGGIHDTRHLWPDWFNLLDAYRPAIIMGEQVTGAAGNKWIDQVLSDLERAGYAARAIDIPACAINLPHARERRWFAAHAYGIERRPGEIQGGRPPIFDRAEIINRSRRPTSSEVPSLDDGVPGGLGLRRIIGNAISPALAAEVIAAFMETSP